MYRTEAGFDQQLDGWIRRNIPEGINAWLERYIDDPDVDDDELRDETRWDVEGAAVHIREMLATEQEMDRLDGHRSIAEAFGLRGPDGAWFYSQLIEFFHDSDVVRQRQKQAAHVEAGGSAALYEGDL